MQIDFVKIFFYTTLLITLSGCVHQPPTPVIDNPQHYQQQLSQLSRWSLEGKIAVRYTNKSDTAALQWQQTNTYFDIFISGPLGTGATHITGTPESLTLQNDQKISTTVPDSRHVLEKHLGWEVPLEKLPQWIIGRHGDNNTVTRFNPDNTLAGFTEHDWLVEYQRYQTVGQWLLPEKMVLTHGDIQVTIFIKHWQLP